MKKLKRGLSLLLVLCMVLTLVPAAFAADEYTDQDQITQTEAVQVMTGMGIIQGMGDGTFQPQGDLTRAQAAKIIAYMKLGEDLAEAMPAADSFSDVSATSWYSKYVAYCAEEGIIAGMGDGTFRPNATLSADQFIKMLLVAVGYNAEYEGLEGSQWAVNTRKLAVSSDLLTTADLKLAFNRETACYYALKAMLMEVQNTSYTYSYTASNGRVISGVGIIGGLGEDVYALELDENYDDDPFARPARQYSYNSGNKETVIVAEPVLTYTTAVTEEKIKKDLKDEDAEIAYTVDGTATEEDVTIADGMLTEVYKNAEGSYAVVVINTYVAKIGHDDINEEAETVTLDEYTYKTTAFAENDVVIYRVGQVENAGAVITAVKADYVAGTATAVANDASYVRIDGTKYVIGANADSSAAATAGSKGTFYLDYYGNIMYYVEEEAAPAPQAPAPKYAYLLKMESRAYDPGSTTESLLGTTVEEGTDAAAKARIIDVETGKNVVVDLAMTMNQDADGYVYLKPNGTPGTTAVGDEDGDDIIEMSFVKYYEMNDGTVVIEEVADEDAPENVTVQANVAEVAGKVADSNTKLITLAIEADENGDVKAESAKDAAVTTVVGIASFPSDETTLNGNALIVTNDAGRVAMIVAINQAPDEGGDPAPVYAILNEWETVNVENKEVDQLTLAVNGETIVANIDKAAEDSDPNTYVVGGIYTVTEGPDGYAVAAVEETAITAATTAVCSVNDGYITWVYGGEGENKDKESPATLKYFANEYVVVNAKGESAQIKAGDMVKYIASEEKIVFVVVLDPPAQP